MKHSRYKTLMLSISATFVAGVLFLLPSSFPSNRKPLSIHTVSGEEIFRDYCSSCHGTDGRGNGPAAPALVSKVPDLTLISKRSRDKFPKVRIRNIIEGLETVSGHGSREMPIWGPVFHEIEDDRDLGAVRTDNLAKYIESIQRR